jgi:hypothetical protein
MAIRYTINTSYPAYPHLPVTRETRSRAPAAENALWRAIFAMIEGQGLRDRPIAWRLLREFESCDLSAPKAGQYHLHHFDCGSERVTFHAERESV